MFNEGSVFGKASWRMDSVSAYERGNAGISVRAVIKSEGRKGVIYWTICMSTNDQNPGYMRRVVEKGLLPEPGGFGMSDQGHQGREN